MIDNRQPEELICVFSQAQLRRKGEDVMKCVYWNMVNFFPVRQNPFMALFVWDFFTYMEIDFTM